MVDQVLKREESGDIGLRFFEGRAEILHLLADRGLAPLNGDTVRAEAVHQLMGQDVREERLEGDQRLLCRVDGHAGRSA